MLWRRLYSDVMLLGGQSKRKYCGFDIAPIFSTCPCQDTIVVICRSFHTTDPLNIILVFMCRALHSPSTVMSDTNGVLGIVATPFRGLRWHQIELQAAIAPFAFKSRSPGAMLIFLGLKFGHLLGGEGYLT